MGYIVIKLYSFACDASLPDGRECPATYDLAPVPAAKSLEPLLTEAIRQLKAEGWAVQGRGADRKHYCPEHIQGGPRDA